MVRRQKTLLPAAFLIGAVGGLTISLAVVLSNDGKQEPNVPHAGYQRPAVSVSPIPGAPPEASEKADKRSEKADKDSASSSPDAKKSNGRTTQDRSSGKGATPGARKAKCRPGVATG